MKHHYVPEFYLKKWAGKDGKIERFRRLSDGRIVSKRLAPAGVGYLHDLYRTPGEDDAQATGLERNFFSRIDDLAAVALNELLAAKRSHTLPPEALEIWRAFILTLLHRSPHYFESLKRATRREYATVIEDLGPKYASVRGVSDPETYEQFLASLGENSADRHLCSTVPTMALSPNMLTFLRSMHWVLMTVPDDCRELLLCDDPLLRTNGLRTEDGHVATALSPRHLLIGAHKAEFLRSVKAMSFRDIVSSMNHSSVKAARLWVVGTDRRQAGFIEKHFGAEPRSALLARS